MNEIENDILHNVFQYLEAADLAKLACVSKKFKTDHEQISKLTWLRHASSKWGVSANHIEKDFPQMDSQQLRSLYPLSAPMIEGIVSEHLDILVDPTTASADFVGRVGESNQSVQGSTFFPVIRESTEETGRSSFIESMMSFASRMAEEFLKECEFPNFELDEPTPTVARHSIPFAVSGKDGQVQFCVKPRCISYYEIEIKPSKYQHDASPTGFECVAVGLATKSFLKNKRMPGWDSESFGYHGDDGAIFHGQGKQLAEFGPRYGCNDTIGCGLNHRDRSIFFTLNGMFLGTAFEDVPKDVELYPTVGIDTNCSVMFNFGKRPFAFDLVNHLSIVDP
jgi:hypothetical protein